MRMPGRARGPDLPDTAHNPNELAFYLRGCFFSLYHAREIKLRFKVTARARAYVRGCTGVLRSIPRAPAPIPAPEPKRTRGRGGVVAVGLSELSAFAKSSTVKPGRYGCTLWHTQTSTAMSDPQDKGKGRMWEDRPSRRRVGLPTTKPGTPASHAAALLETAGTSAGSVSTWMVPQRARRRRFPELQTSAVSARRTTQHTSTAPHVIAASFRR